MSFPVELEFSQESPEIVLPAVASPNVIEAMECIDCAVAETEQLAVLDTQRVDDVVSDLKQTSRKSSITCEEFGKPEVETLSDPTIKVDPPIKSDSRKRKRSLDNGISDKEIQRRSTRSRAYAQQAEEDIYSLRAELRSFLPTSLL